MPPHGPVSSTDVFRPDILKGQVVFATGAGTGINRGVVQTFMNHGCNAFIIGRRENVITEAAAALSKETGSQCVGMSADVRKPETLERAVAECIKRFGRIDHVILGAAGNFLQLLEGISVNAFNNVVAIDLGGSYATFKATIEHVLKSQGTYIAISATLHYTGLPLQGPASAAKAGVDSLSRVIAVEYGPRGVRSNVIAPGPIAGTVGMEKLGRRVDGDERDPESIVPTQRYGDVRDIGNAALFLASPAGSFVNGTEIVVDGGLGGLYPDVVKLDPAMFRGDSKL